MSQPTHATSFSRFGRLPAELRFIIWELCLPTRIIPLSVLVVAHQQRHLPHRRGSPIARLLKTLLAQPCRISQVCRESRAVATSRRQHAEALDLAWLGRGSWLDPRTDTLLLDCDVFKRYRSLWRQIRRALARGAGPAGSSGPNRVHIAMCEDLAGYECKSANHYAAEEGDVIADGEITASGFRQRTWPVVMDKIWLRMTEDVACTTGLFGVFGEEHTVLVHVRDGARLGLLEELRGLHVDRVIDARQLVRRALDRWKKRCSKFWSLSREVGFAGSEEEWRLTRFGPYPVIQVQWDDIERGLTG